MQRIGVHFLQQMTDDPERGERGVVGGWITSMRERLSPRQDRGKTIGICGFERDREPDGLRPR